MTSNAAMSRLAAISFLFASHVPMTTRSIAVTSAP